MILQLQLLLLVVRYCRGGLRYTLCFWVEGERSVLFMRVGKRKVIE